MSRGLTKTKCPFHADAKRSDIVAKLLEEDYYQPVANVMIDVGGGTILSPSPKTLVLELLSTCAYMSVQYESRSASKKRFDIIY